MAKETQKKRRLSVIGRLFLWLALFIGITITSLSILCNSKWAKTKLSQKLERVIPGQWGVRAIYIDPTLKIHVVGLTHDDFEIQELTIAPNLWTLASGGIRLKKLHLESVVGAVDLSKLRPSVDRGAHRRVAKVEAEEAPPAVQPSAPRLKVEDAQVAASQLIQKHAINLNASSELASNENSEVSSDGYDAWLVIENLDLNCHWDGEPWFSIQDVDAEIPIAGSDLKGEISWDGVYVRSFPLMGKSSVCVEKTHGRLSLEEPKFEVLGVSVEPNLGLVNTAHGLVFVADIHVPEQVVTPVHLALRDWQILSRAESLSGRFQAVGPLLSPQNWRGRCGMVARGLEAIESSQREAVHFDRLNLSAHLDSGSLNLREYSLIGEQVSLRGNGQFDLNGTGYGVLRVMVPAQQARWIDGLYNDVFKGRQSDARVMHPLHGGDLEFTDIYIDGALWSPSIKFNNSAQWNLLWPVVKQSWTSFSRN